MKLVNIVASNPRLNRALRWNYRPSLPFQDYITSRSIPSSLVTGAGRGLDLASTGEPVRLTDSSHILCQYNDGHCRKQVHPACGSSELGTIMVGLSCSALMFLSLRAFSWPMKERLGSQMGWIISSAAPA